MMIQINIPSLFATPHIFFKKQGVNKMNDLITITVTNDKKDCEINFQLNKEELKEFLEGKVFKSMLDNLLQISFKK
jgi:hypothetical protein